MILYDKLNGLGNTAPYNPEAINLTLVPKEPGPPAPVKKSKCFWVCIAIATGISAVGGATYYFTRK